MIPFLHGVFATNGGVANDFELIETQTVGAGGAASVTFSSIPGTYKHLQIRGIGQTNRGTYPVDDMLLRFNSDTSTSYAYHQLYGTGAAAGSNGAASNTGIVSWATFGTQQWFSPSLFGACIVDVLDYASTSKYKTTRTLSGLDSNNSGTVPGSVVLSSGLWMSVAAVSSVTLVSNTSSTFQQNSTFALYGVK